MTRPWARHVLESRFWAKVDKTPGQGPAGDCWTFTATKFRSGYGSFFDGQKNRLAHRVAYELQFGPIPWGALVRHRCHVQLCVRHLELGTHEQNVADQVARRYDDAVAQQPGLFA